MRDVIAEGLGDIDVAAAAPGRRPLEMFTRRVMALRWSDPRTSADVRRFVTTDDALFDADPSDLCADADALVADSRQTAPPQTLQWLENFKRLTQAASAAGRRSAAT